MYITASYKSKMMTRGVGIHVFLPCHDGYPDAAKPYPTLYFLPGFSGNAEELATMLPFRQMSALYGVAVVIPDGENSFYTDHPERCAMNGSYVDEELVQVTRKLFPALSARREDTFIGGISMGGYGAAAHGLRRCEAFSRIVMMSPAIEADKLFQDPAISAEGGVPGELFEQLMGGQAGYEHSWLNPQYSLLELQKAGRDIPKLYMCCGRQDPLVYDACTDFRRFLARHGIPLVYDEGDGLHDVPYWDRQLENCFRFLTAKA